MRKPRGQRVYSRVGRARALGRGQEAWVLALNVQGQRKIPRNGFEAETSKIGGNWVVQRA